MEKRWTLSEAEREYFFDKSSKANAWAFFAMFLLLAIVISVLMYLIRLKDRYLKRENSVFKKEKLALTITLIVFSISYLLRWIWDLSISTTDTWRFFHLYLAKLVMSYIADFLPFICIFILHFKNFSKQKVEVAHSNIANYRNSKEEAFAK